MTKHWRVLSALLGIVVIQGLLLSEAFSPRFAREVEARLRGMSVNPFDFPGQVTHFQDSVYMTCLGLALFAWSWTSAFVLGHLSRHVAWINWFLFYLVVLNSYWMRRLIAGDVRASTTTWSILLDSLVPYYNLGCLLLFVPAGIWGLMQSFRPGAFRRRLLVLIASGTVVLSSLLYWMGAWYDAAPPGPSKLWVIALLTGPAVYIIAAAEAFPALSSRGD